VGFSKLGGRSPSWELGRATTSVMERQDAAPGLPDGDVVRPGYGDATTLGDFTGDRTIVHPERSATPRLKMSNHRVF
jgi:hypothetical protein